MQQHELDELVARIGDAFLARLDGGATPVARAAEPAKKAVGCACEHGAEEAKTAPDFRPPAGWEKRAVELARLDPAATTAEIRAAAEDAKRSELAGLTVLSQHAGAAARALRGSSTRVIAVVGYPHGGLAGPLKLAETELALGQGAAEIEWTVSLGALREGRDDLIYGELRSAVEMAHRAGASLSFAIEMSDLEERRKLTAAVLGRLAGADMVAIVAGRCAHGRVLPSDVSSIRRALGDGTRIKAGGGVDGWSALGALAAAGADAAAVDTLAALAR